MQAKTFLMHLLMVMMTLFSSIELRAKESTQVVSVKDAWIRTALPVQRTSALYFTLQNRGENAVKLLDVETSLANNTMFHTTIEEDGVAKMRHRASVSIDAGEVVVFEPGGLHVMLMGLNHPVSEGKKVEVMLHFDDGLSQRIDVEIKSSL